MRYPICAKYYESYNRYLRVSSGLSRLQVLLYRCIKMCSHLTVGVEGLVIEHTSYCFVRVFRAWLLQSRWIIGVHWTMCIPVKPNQLQWTYYRSKGGAVVRALDFHQSGPISNTGVDATILWGISLLLGLFGEVFPRVLWFPFSSKTNIFKFQFDQESGRRRVPKWMWYL